MAAKPKAQTRGKSANTRLRPKRRCLSKTKRRKATRLCKQLKKSPLFKRCRAVVPVARYYKSCRTDACECPSKAGGRCHCESLLAYVRACEKADTRAHPTLVPADWRTSTSCSTILPQSSSSNRPRPDPHHLHSAFGGRRRDGGTADSHDEDSKSTRFDHHLREPEHSACGSILGARFSLCAVPMECHPTCDQPSVIMAADCAQKLSCRPGCECPEGTLLHRQKCILDDQCAEEQGMPPALVPVSTMMPHRTDGGDKLEFNSSLRDVSIAPLLEPMETTSAIAPWRLHNSPSSGPYWQPGSSAATTVSPALPPPGVVVELPNLKSKVKRAGGSLTADDVRQIPTNAMRDKT